MRFYGKAESVATRIIEHFKTGNISQALAPIFIHRNDDIPCRSWSWSNQLLAALAGYDDARTYRDWQNVGRQVTKGQKSFHILEPCKKMITDTASGEDRCILYGFKAGARFGLEQTEVTDEDRWAGHQDNDHTAERFLDALPFVNVARHWGLSVRSYNGREGSALGKYRHGQSIAVGVENLATWAHELIHAADDRLGQLTERGQHWRSETVAELGGAVLLCCVGMDHEADLGGAWTYIEYYAKANDGQTVDAAMAVLNRVCKAVALILDAAEALDAEALQSDTLQSDTLQSDTLQSEALDAEAPGLHAESEAA